MNRPLDGSMEGVEPLASELAPVWEDLGMEKFRQNLHETPDEQLPSTIAELLQTLESPYGAKPIATDEPGAHLCVTGTDPAEDEAARTCREEAAFAEAEGALIPDDPRELMRMPAFAELDFDVLRAFSFSLETDIV